LQDACQSRFAATFGRFRQEAVRILTALGRAKIEPPVIALFALISSHKIILARALHHALVFPRVCAGRCRTGPSKEGMM